MCIYDDELKKKYMCDVQINVTNLKLANEFVYIGYGNGCITKNQFVYSYES